MEDFGKTTVTIEDMEALCAALRTALPRAKFDVAGPNSIFLGSMVGLLGVEWGSRRKMDPVEMRHRIDGITADDIAKVLEALPSVRAGHDNNERDRLAGVGRSWRDGRYGPEIGDFLEVRGTLRIVTSSTRSTVTEAQDDCAEGQTITYFGYRYPTESERERFEASGQRLFD